MKRTSIAVALCMGCALVQGGILPDVQYRYCSPGDSLTNGQCSKTFCGSLHAPACRTTAATPLPEVENGSGKGGVPYKIVFMEYNDKGQRWDFAQREIAKAVLEEARKGDQPVTLLTYVHGWQNNADRRPKNNPGDVEKFENYVQEYTDNLTAASHRSVVGVYLAWRGKSINVAPYIDWLSFWTRGIAARIVGDGDIREDITCLVGWGKGPIGPDGKLPDCAEIGPKTMAALPPAPPLRAEGVRPLVAEPLVEPVDTSHQNRIILRGHSFGGRVLDWALLSGGNRGTIQAQQCAELEHGRAVVAKLDLLLLVNSATGGVNVRRQLKKCQPCSNEDHGCGDYKQQKADYTKPSTMAQSPAFSNPTACDTSDALSERCQPYPLVLSISGKKDFLTRLLLPIAGLGQIPASFMIPLQTHEAVDATLEQEVDVIKGELFKFQTESGQTFIFQRKVKTKYSPTNPIWTLDVDPQIIKNHDDVWNGSVLNLEMNLMNFGNPRFSVGNSSADPAHKIILGRQKK